MDLRRDDRVARQHEAHALAPRLREDPLGVLELILLDQALAPSSMPLAARNVFAIPPPTSTAWQRDSSASRTSSLPETFAPPMTAWNGLAGFSSSRDSASTSRSISRPATAGRWWVIPSVDACARCAAPKASLTYTSAKPGERLRELGIVRLLRPVEAEVLEEEQVARPQLVDCHLHARRRGRRRSSAPGRPSSCARRSATGFRRSASFTLPLGRPRWLARMTEAPRSSRWMIVGRLARIRVSSVILPSSSGTLRSARRKTRFPVTSTSRTVLLSIGAS
jgi:hypothetical protein